MPSRSWFLGFAAGIFDAEGSHSGSALRICNSSDELIAWTCDALDEMGVPYVVEDYDRPNRVRYIRVTRTPSTRSPSGCSASSASDRVRRGSGSGSVTIGSRVTISGFLPKNDRQARDELIAGTDRDPANVAAALPDAEPAEAGV